MDKHYFIVITDSKTHHITASKFVDKFDEAKEFLDKNIFIGCDCSLYELEMIAKGYNGGDLKAA